MSRPRSQSQRRGHSYALERLSSYMDGQLSDREQTRVRAHLNTCPDCRAELRSLRWTQDLLRQTPAIPVPRSFIVREADLERRPAPRAQPRFARSLAGLQAAAAVVAVLLVLVVAGDVFLGQSFLMSGAAPAVSMRDEGIETITVAALAAPEQVQAPPTDEQKPEGQEPDTQPEMALVAATDTAAAPTVEPSPTWTARPRATPTPSEFAAEGTSTEHTKTATPLPVRMATPEPTPSPTAEPTPGTEPTPTREAERGVAVAVSPTPGQAESEESKPVDPPPSPTPDRQGRIWRVAQVGLGALLVGLVVTILLLRFTRRFG